MLPVSRSPTTRCSRTPSGCWPAPVGLDALALEFAETSASSRRGARRGRALLPADARGHRGRDVVGPHQPVRLQAGRRRGRLRGRADPQGEGGRASAARRRPERIRSGGGRAGALRAARGRRRRGLRHPRDEAPRAVGPLGSGGATRWNLAGLGHIDHRKVLVVDGRIGWIGGAGIEDHFQDGRFHDLFLRGHRAGRLAAPARVPRQLPLAGRLDPRGGARRLCSRASEPGRRSRRSSSTTLRATVRSPT